MDDTVTIVSGLPRSGTSLMMQMLGAGGMPLLTDGLRAADDSNRRGYFEYEPVKRLRHDRAWLPEARGRAVKIIHLLLRELPLDMGLRYRVVFMDRALDEVLASQRTMLAQGGRAAADDAVLRRAFEGQLAQLATWLAAQPRIEVLRVSHHELMRDPLATSTAVAAFVGEPRLDPAAMAGAVDPGLHRQRLAR